MCKKAASIHINYRMNFVQPRYFCSGTAKSVCFTEQQGVCILESCKVLRIMQIQSGPHNGAVEHNVAVEHNMAAFSDLSFAVHWQGRLSRG